MGGIGNIKKGGGGGGADNKEARRGGRGKGGGPGERVKKSHGKLRRKVEIYEIGGRGAERGGEGGKGWRGAGI